MTPAPPHRQLVVGTAGHIDHGKSTLVRQLTGVDPDRLPEEKARGMTIDLGFAHLRIGDCDVWFVDVPGHERFIRNMVAGAAGVDLALLVVAADDAVMPQTREHAELLKLLGVDRCILTLTKTDLVDAEWAAAVEAEARDLLASLGLTPLAAVHTSAIDGRGYDALRTLLADAAAANGPHRAAASWFRMPIDRAFTVAGRGTVVTGTVAHGSVAREAELELWPAGRRVRVRDLQSHNEGRSAAAGRMRLAVNLAGVALDETARGHVLATPNYLTPTHLFEARLPLLRMPGRTPRRILRLRLHVGTTETLAEVRLAERPDQRELRDAVAQVRPARPLTTVWGERFILRDETGLRTLGGGRVLRVHARPWTARRSPDPEAATRLESPRPRERLEEVVRGRRWPGARPDALAAEAGLVDALEASKLLRELSAAGRLAALQPGVETSGVALQVLEEAGAAVAARLRQARAAQPRWAGVPLREWPAWMPRECPEEWRTGLAERLLTAGFARARNGYVLPADEPEALAPPDQALLDELLAEFKAGGVQPPGAEELKCQRADNAERLAQLIELAAARGELRRLAPGIWLHRDCWEQVVRQVAAHIRAAGPATVSQLREMLGTTRKYMVPLAEALDAAGITQRIGDTRRLGPKAG